MEQYGIIGKPLGHSFSQAYFTQFFADEGLAACYLPFELESINELPGLVAAHPDLRGFNVTIPYKQQVIPFLDHLDTAAAAIGAVNVVKVRKKDRDVKPVLTGYNTDHIGFYRSFETRIQPHFTRALVLGTGGAAKAIAYALKRFGIRSTFVSRTPQAGQLGYASLTESVMHSYDIIVNCTPSGTYPAIDTCPDIPYEYLDERQFCFDLVYNPAQTLFLQRAAAQGCATCNGLEMLHIQADESWKIWNEE